MVKSTIAAENYMIRAILLELYKKETDGGSFPMPCYTGNKLLKVDVCIIRDMLEKKKEISSVNWCTSKT